MIYQIQNARFLRMPALHKQSASLIIDSQHQLFLGDHTALQSSFLHAHNIANVITVNQGVQTPQHNICKGTRQHFFIIKDNPSRYDFSRANNLISQCLSQGNLLVNCASGHSRSPAIVIGYLMQSHGFSLRAAMEHIRSKRFQANPILSVKKALKNFQMVLNSQKHQENQRVFTDMTKLTHPRQKKFYEMKRKVIYKSIMNKVIDDDFNKNNADDLKRKEEFLFNRTQKSLVDPRKICGETLQIKSSWVHRK